MLDRDDPSFGAIFAYSHNPQPTERTDMESVPTHDCGLAQKRSLKFVYSHKSNKLSEKLKNFDKKSVLLYEEQNCREIASSKIIFHERK